MPKYKIFGWNISLSKDILYWTLNQKLRPKLANYSYIYKINIIRNEITNITNITIMINITNMINIINMLEIINIFVITKITAILAILT